MSEPQAEYVYQEYPRMMYHRDGRVAVVNSDEELKALGAGWVKSPAEYGVETCPPASNIRATGYVQPGYPAPGPPSTAEAEAAADVARLEAEAAAQQQEAEQRRRR